MTNLEQEKNIIEDVNIKQRFLSDSSAGALLLSNLVLIVYAIFGQLSLGAVMITYWTQSVIIGIFNFFKILRLKDFSTDNLKINGRSVEPTSGTKAQVAFFFSIHYGLFHFVYAVFLYGLFLRTGQVESGELLAVFSGGAIFFANHLYSFNYNRERDSKKVPNIGRILFYPYARILPMHLAIMLAGAIVNKTATAIFVLVVFMGLKTLADLIMHYNEHKI